MEIHLERQTEQKLSLSAILSLSSSSSTSSSSTSSSCSSSSFRNDAYGFSGQNEDRLGNAPRLRFIDFLSDNGREWKLAEKRFDQLSWTSVGSEPAVKWSNFAFCIGEMLRNDMVFSVFLFLFQIIHSSQQSKTSMNMKYQKLSTQFPKKKQ